MSDDFRMDSHKLIFHPERVSNWMRGEVVYPICIEISPSGSCNHRCIFCGLDYLGYKPVFLDKDCIIDNLEQMSQKGLRSVVVCGEGEPLLNKDTPEIINKSKKIGIDMALASNGVLFTDEVSKECLGSLTWIRFSVNAGSEKIYHKVHNGKSGDFNKVITNINSAVEQKKKGGLNTTIGVQFLLLPENVNGVSEFAKKLKMIGIDYFSVKPYSKHPKSYNEIDSNFDYNFYIDIGDELMSLSDESFKVIFRAESMKKKSQSKCYDKCWGLPYWAYIDANAEIWACIAYIGDKSFSYGNLKDSSFVEIWESQRGKEIWQRALTMDVSGCRELCRLDAINTYLHELKNPGGHVNFI